MLSWVNWKKKLIDKQVFLVNNSLDWNNVSKSEMRSTKLKRKMTKGINELYGDCLEKYFSHKN